MSGRFLITTGIPDLVASPARVNQIAFTALAVSRWQLGVCRLLLVGGGVGREELAPGEVGGCTGC